MAIEVKVPALPESIADATVSKWHKKEGDAVTRDENIVDLETDKVMLEVPSPVDGIIKKIVKASGTTVSAQEVIALIEEGGKASASQETATKKSAAESAKTAASPAPTKEAKLDKPAVPAKQEATPTHSTGLSPSARRAAMEKGEDSAKPASTSTSTSQAQSASSIAFVAGDRPEKRVPMTRMRARIAERLMDVKQNTAMLTTFNEVNMAPIMQLRQRYKEKFEKKYNIRLGFMSFFVRASLEALKRSPIVNASMDGDDIVYHGFYDVGVAVSTDRGLVVPVLRDVDKMSMAQIESNIAQFAEKAKNGKLALEEMQGGTFTITNGGVFGSLFSMPILNAPQCAILGMHAIQERPVVEHGQIVIRPMMYVALTYDHRLIDGKESVSFLMSIKESLEDPMRLLLEV